MIKKNIYISSLDISLLLIIMLLIGLLAIRYDAQKGLGDKNLISVQIATISPKGFNPAFSDFIAIKFDNNTIEILIIKSNLIVDRQTATCMTELLSIIKITNTLVIYAPLNQQKLFRQTINTLIDNNISFIVAKT